MTPPVRIERIEVVGRDSRARRLVFSDGVEPRTTAACVVKTLALAEGDEIELDDLAALLVENESLQARERALRLVGYRERSRHELATRLADDGYPGEVVLPLVERFVERSFVDDVRFAASLVRARVSGGFGTRRITRELSDKGVHGDVIEAVLAGAECGDDLTRAIALVGTRPVSTRAERDKVVRRLVSRGFELGTAYSAVNSVSRSVAESEPFVGE